jgi:hypothetical protein
VTVARVRVLGCLGGVAPARLEVARGRRRGGVAGGAASAAGG